MTTFTRYQTPLEQYIDANGNPIAGGKLYFYVTGTSTLKNTYSDVGLTTPNTNPVILNDSGRVETPIFMASGDYKVSLTDANDVPVDGFPQDPVAGLAVAGITLPTPSSPTDYGKTIQVNSAGDNYELTETLNRAYVIADPDGAAILKLKDEGASTATLANPYLSLGYSSAVGGVYNEVARFGYTDTSTTDLSISNLQGNVYKFTGTASDAAELRLFEDTDNGTDYVGLKAPASVATSKTWTLPATDAVGGFVTSDGSGVLSVSLSNKLIAKAWVNFNGTGTIAINASYNVTSLTDNGTGDYTVNFTTALGDANYSMAGMCRFGVGISYGSMTLANGGTKTTTALRVNSWSDDAGLVDCTEGNVIVFGN